MECEDWIANNGHNANLSGCSTRGSAIVGLGMENKGHAAESITKVCSVCAQNDSQHFKKKKEKKGNANMICFWSGSQTHLQRLTTNSLKLWGDVAITGLTI